MAQFEQSFQESFNTVEALGTRVIVQRLEALKQLASGLILPGPINEKPMRGKVIAVGPGKALDTGGYRPMAIQPGEYVLFGKYSGTEFVFNGTELLVMFEEDIMARFSNEDDMPTSGHLAGQPA